MATTATDLQVLARVGRALGHPLRREVLLRLLDGPADVV